MDNARARLYIANFNPAGITRRKAALLGKALSILDDWGMYPHQYERA